jgi:tripartite motif-containing protein 71
MPGFQYPSSVEIGPSGISYVVDRNKHTITLWDQNGSFITRMSKYGSGAGQLHRPEDIAVSQKEIYVVNYDGHRVEVFDLNGTFVRTWGKHGSNDGEFYHPSSIALDMNGSRVYEVFIADRYHHEIEVFDSNGTYKRKIGENGNGDHQFNEPTGVKIGPDGLLYVSSKNHNKIKVFDTNGSYLRSFSTSSNPFDISFHGDKLAVSLYDNHKVQIFDKNGSEISTDWDWLPIPNPRRVLPS